MPFISPRTTFTKNHINQRKNYLKINKEELKNIKPVRNSNNKSPEKNSKEVKPGMQTTRDKSGLNTSRMRSESPELQRAGDNSLAFKIKNNCVDIITGSRNDTNFKNNEHKEMTLKI